MERGTVKWFSEEKEFGLVEPDNGGDEIFLPRSAIFTEDLEKGDRVEFEIEETEKELFAEDTVSAPGTISVIDGHLGGEKGSFPRRVLDLVFGTVSEDDLIEDSGQEVSR